MTTNQVYGAKLQEKRKAKGLKQAVVAQALNINRYTLSRIENGKVKISMEFITAYCKLLKTPIQEIIK